MVTRLMNGWFAQDQDRRRALRWLLVSIAIHLPLTPLGPLFGLLALVSRTEQPAAPVEELNGIPVELLDPSKQPDEPKPEVPPATVEKDEFAPESALLPPKKKQRPDIEPLELDAGVAMDAGTELQPIALLDASTAEGPVAMNSDAGAVPSTTPPVSSEQALAAATHGIADSNANIRINLFMDRVRQQPLGVVLGNLLKSVYQWRDFFAPGGLDPVKDFDQIQLFGPQLRDSSQVAAFLKHNVRSPRIRGAIDRLVKNSGSGSSWLKGTKYPAARAMADRAQRSFVMYPSQVVAVVPPKVEKDALALPSFQLPSAKGDELASVFVKTPWRALLGTKFRLSRTIQSATIRIFPDDDGGAHIEAVLEDESATLAQQDAKDIKRDVDAVTLASNWLLSGSRFAEPVQITLENGTIHAILRVTRPQAERIFKIAEGLLTPEGQREARSALAPANSDAGGQAPTKTVPGRVAPVDAGSTIPSKSPPTTNTAAPQTE
jgi:hypothetical protein